jgi:hypothetical protein
MAPLSSINGDRCDKRKEKRMKLLCTSDVFFRSSRFPLLSFFFSFSFYACLYTHENTDFEFLPVRQISFNSKFITYTMVFVCTLFHSAFS